ncbi:hypothetical protein [Nocardioides sp. SYSU DS0663]|uniref:hypothetical protein n=1 Tax=Nocardioides sp. SYSU DS0663 TaxID=3416445 RepID=UPI003F4C9AD5
MDMISQTPALARSDVRSPRGTSASPTRPFRRHGLLLSAGAVSWGIAQLAVGVNVDHDALVPNLAYSLTALLFQAGLLALLSVVLRTGALGSGRLARALVRVEMALVALAMLSTAGDAAGLTDMDQLGWLLLDMNWPLSMLGMFLIGVRVAVAGRWQGRARYWPLLAESWLVVVMPTMVVLGEGAATVVSFLHLTLGYGVLGRIVAAKETDRA